MKTDEEHEEAIREYLGVNDSSITEYEHIEENKYYVTLLIDIDVDKETLQLKKQFINELNKE